MSLKHFVICGDTHGSEVSIEASEAFFKFLKIWKPPIRIHLGDAFDARPLRKGASEEEKRETIYTDFNAGMDFLEQMKPTVFLRGNHDERIYDLATNGYGMAKEFALDLTSKIEKKLDKFKCPMLPYSKRDGIYELGKLKVAHGYAHGTLAARKMAASFGNIVFGHTHGIQVYSMETVENIVGMNIGCMCKLDFNYNRAMLGSLVHRHGFAYGVVDTKTGEFQVFQAQSVNGRWILAQEVVEL
jgi:predicted phosphodiesterase